MIHDDQEAYVCHEDVIDLLLECFSNALLLVRSDSLGNRLPHRIHLTSRNRVPSHAIGHPYVSNSSPSSSIGFMRKTSGFKVWFRQPLARKLPMLVRTNAATTACISSRAVARKGRAGVQAPENGRIGC